MDYESYANVMKALADPKRVKILDMLSAGELCACQILDHFDFTQPTLSHHIKLLLNAGLVTVKKTGTWHYYSLNEERMDRLVADTLQLAMKEAPCMKKEAAPRANHAEKNLTGKKEASL